MVKLFGIDLFSKKEQRELHPLVRRLKDEQNFGKIHLLVDEIKDMYDELLEEKTNDATANDHELKELLSMQSRLKELQDLIHVQKWDEVRELINRL
jgi:ElaB/YqjD/DUF883 family membrane-anchored ribosome-binding protein